jgi:hypothetical protein
MRQNNRTPVHARVAVLAAILLGSVAQARTNPEYDDCLLQHLKTARLDIATQMITQACYQNYVDDFTKKRDIKRNECLLENLPGIESLEAVGRVSEVCDRKSKEK